MNTDNPLYNQDLMSLVDWSAADIQRVLQAASAWKANPAQYADALTGTDCVMLFEKPSLRTRVSFEIGLQKLGANALYYDASKAKLGVRESVKDFANVLDRYCGLIVARVFSQAALDEFASYTKAPVINALSDMYHPCQALADVLTITEWCNENNKDPKSVRVAYVGDGNNVCHSLMLAACKLGMDFVWVGPDGFEPSKDIVARCTKDCETSGGSVKLSHNLTDVAGADAVYTDTWVSMGDEEHHDRLEAAFRGYQVDAGVMKNAGEGAIFLHCLPAHRGSEVTDEVIDSENSRVYDQAENRMWAQGGLILNIFGKA